LTLAREFMGHRRIETTLAFYVEVDVSAMPDLSERFTGGVGR